MIEIDANWKLGADQYQWILYERKIKAEKYASLPEEVRVKRKEFVPAYYHPHLKDAMHHLSRLSVLTSDFESFTELEQKYESRWAELVEKMNLHREGFKELACDRYSMSEGKSL